MLEDRLAEVNQRIASGENEHFQVKRRGQQVRWTLQYPRGSEPVNHSFFDAMKQVDIDSILHFANRHCRFMETLRQLKNSNPLPVKGSSIRWLRDQPEFRAFLGSLIALNALFS